MDEARAAVERHDWQGALDLLTPDRDLDADALLLKAEALWWDGQPQAAEEAYEQAFAGFLASDRVSDAAVVAGLLAYMAARRSAMAVAGGWVSRLGELLDGQPESLGHVWSLALQQAFALFGGNVDALRFFAIPFSNIRRRGRSGDRFDHRFGSRMSECLSSRGSSVFLVVGVSLLGVCSSLDMSVY